MMAWEDVRRERKSARDERERERRAGLIAEGKTCNLPFCLISAILWVKSRKLWDALCTLTSPHPPPTLLLCIIFLSLPYYIKGSIPNILTSRASSLTFRFMLALLAHTEHISSRRLIEALDLMALFIKWSYESSDTFFLFLSPGFNPVFNVLSYLLAMIYLIQRQLLLC